MLYTVCNAPAKYGQFMQWSRNRVCESVQESVFDRSQCFVYIWYTSVRSPSNLQVDAAFIVEICRTGKALEMFKMIGL